jgi:hypothetical protein
MYDFLLKHVNRKTANVLIIVWHLLLILTILYLMMLPEGEFRYLNY